MRFSFYRRIINSVYIYIDNLSVKFNTSPAQLIAISIYMYTQSISHNQIVLASVVYSLEIIFNL